MKFTYKNSHLLSDNDIKKTADSLKEYTQHLKTVADSHSYEAAESSMNLPSDEELLQKVMDLKNKKITSKLKYIIDVGIGGSNLGTKAIYDVFFGFYDTLQPNRFPKMIFLDTNEGGTLSKLSDLSETFQSKEEFIINAISKSGGTTETIANLEVLLTVLEKKFGDVKDRLVITSDEGSKLWNMAVEKKVDVLPLPKQVGGRYSVLSAVGLFPLAACGIDIKKVREGAEEIKKQCITKDIMNNPALLSAVIIYLHYKQGKNINDTFFFLPQLESMGKWYRQLMGESLGKEDDLQGNKVHVGITPTLSIGSTDLHSVGQLYLGGPKDKITTFVWAEESEQDVSLPSTLQFPLINDIQGKKISEIMTAIREGVKVAYTKQRLPYTEVVFDTVSEKTLGEFLQFKMVEMMYLGKLLNVNTFDQPHVELYKIETKRFLSWIK